MALLSHIPGSRHPERFSSTNRVNLSFEASSLPNRGGAGSPGASGLPERPMTSSRPRKEMQSRLGTAFPTPNDLRAVPQRHCPKRARRHADGFRHNDLAAPRHRHIPQGSAVPARNSTPQRSKRCRIFRHGRSPRCSVKEPRGPSFFPPGRGAPLLRPTDFHLFRAGTGGHEEVLPFFE